MAGWGLLLVGAATTLYSVRLWGTEAPLLTGLFAVLTVGGGLLVAGRESAYYYLLPVASALALLKSAGYYLNHGVTALTLLFAAVGIVSLVKGVQAYRLLR